ncbi:MAG: 16S rRNA (adenine(1518)-N(6)/adenine(1519)-N(6))-dimethyltransferase RsmA [Candidatus Electryonea clarkiae]|nr:16S rRNA (adenine(1518)-N(6)/adenine(1519)-N(6))-dimethyltransferase RsmA [Candidatus Electryonea clarkiae]
MKTKEIDSNRLASPIGYSRKHGGLPPGKKSLGQNWLTDPTVAYDIAKLLELKEQDLVLEVGPGGGALTEALLTTGAEIIAVEIDKEMIRILSSRWEEQSRLRLEHSDILQADWESLTGGREFSIAGNLPFHITSSLLFKIMDYAREQPGKIKRIAVMVQLEVAKRIVSKPGSSEYGILSVFMRFWGEPQLSFKVPAQAFKPVPKVDAAILLMDIAAEPVYPSARWDTVRRLVKGTFRMRRKMLRNSMPTIANITPWQDIDFDWTRRPQTVSAAEFAWLAEQLEPRKNIKVERNNA